MTTFMVIEDRFYCSPLRSEMTSYYLTWNVL